MYIYFVACIRFFCIDTGKDRVMVDGKRGGDGRDKWMEGDQGRIVEKAGVENWCIVTVLYSSKDTNESK